MKAFVLYALALTLSNGLLHAGIFNTNLLLNGDAEAGAGSPLGDTVVSVPGWTTTNGFTVTIYGTASDIPTNCPGPSTRGTNLFTGGFDNTVSSAVQLIDITPVAAQVDSGLVFAELAGYLGGWQTQNDSSALKAEFYNGVTTNLLGTISIGPVLAIDRTNQTALLLRTKIAKVPPGARQAKITLSMNYTSGSYNDGYADNLSFLLTTNRPALKIQNGTSIIVSWPTNFAMNYSLQQNTNLASTNWVASTNIAVVVNGTNQITVIPSTANKFFRLAHP